MMSIHPEILAKSSPPQSLYDHLSETREVIVDIAAHLQMDEQIAANGAILHDIGKAHPLFQESLSKKDKKGKNIRHEIVSLLFLSLFPRNQWDTLIDMVVAHHKSAINDANGGGILDLIDGSRDIKKIWIGDWDVWSSNAIDILVALGIEKKTISYQEAYNTLEYVLNYVTIRVEQYGPSLWRGLMMAADHLTSALQEYTNAYKRELFTQPNLAFYNERQSALYPLSLKQTDDRKPHTLVIAPTGAGKTDFLIRRCRGRLFYTLPFQASINAMYRRISKDLFRDNPHLDIRVLHAASKIVIDGKLEEQILQSLPGAAIKVLTPHQLGSIVFGIKGYEALLIDLQGCDIILDEIHTYAGFTQWMVLKIVHILLNQGCIVHIGSATLPTVLMQNLLSLMGESNTQVIRLSDTELESFDRHIIHKIDAQYDLSKLIAEAIQSNKKILIVENTVENAQKRFADLRQQFDTPMLLIHSKFKRGDRARIELELMGKDSEGNNINIFNTSEKSCIVVSTQVVEVSLDISFDLMITACAPLDSLIQRFGRINRKRREESRHYDPIYVIEPELDKNKALPYEVDVLEKSYSVLPDNKILKETEVQQLMDIVFPLLKDYDLDDTCIVDRQGNFKLGTLTHLQKSVLLEKMNIDSVSCITESDESAYKTGRLNDRMVLEIPMKYWSVKHLRQIEEGSAPFILPDNAYDKVIGVIKEALKEKNMAKYELL